MRCVTRTATSVALAGLVFASTSNAAKNQYYSGHHCMTREGTHLDFVTEGLIVHADGTLPPGVITCPLVKLESDASYEVIEVVTSWGLDDIHLWEVDLLGDFAHSTPAIETVEGDVRISTIGSLENPIAPLPEHVLVLRANGEVNDIVYAYRAKQTNASY